MATISLDLEDPARFAKLLERARRGVQGPEAWEAFSTAAYQIQEQTSGDAEQANREHRREVAVSVLEAIDVDQYLIDAVRNASPVPADVTPGENATFVEGFDVACNEIIRDLVRLREAAITAPEQCQLDKAIAAAEHQKEWA